MPPAQGAQAPNPLDVMVAKYEALSADTNAIDAITEIDEIRRLQFKNAMSRAQREKDPFMKAKRQAVALQTVRSDLAYHLGKLVLPGVIVNDDQKMPLYTTTGTEWLNDKYNIRE